jgi:hypothetical protein
MDSDSLENCLREYPGDALLSRLLWRPLSEATPDELWGYFSSRPRRYSLEPPLRQISHYRYACRCRGALGACKHVGDLELECQLSSRTGGAGSAERATCWLRASDVRMNPDHASVMAQYVFVPPKEGRERVVSRAIPVRR